VKGYLFVVLVVSSLWATLAAGQASQQASKAKSSPTKVELDKLLTVQEVEKIGGRAVKRTVDYQGMTFTTQEQVMGSAGDFSALMVTLMPSIPDWEGWAKGNGLETHVSGVGDDARQDGTKYMFVLRKGTRIVMMQSMKDPYHDQPYFSPDQMREFGKLIASRL